MIATKEKLKDIGARTQACKIKIIWETIAEECLQIQVYRNNQVHQPPRKVEMMPDGVERRTKIDKIGESRMPGPTETLVINRILVNQIIPNQQSQEDTLMPVPGTLIN